MKEVALSALHQSLGAKMIDFAGFLMPVQYEGVISEHLAVREGVGVFDVSHMGEFFISGPNALDLIQKVTTNDASKLTIGRAQYSCMTNPQGGIVDDLVLYKLKEEDYLMVVNGANIEKDFQWLQSQNAANAELRNASDEYSLLSIQGPKALQTLQKLTSLNLSDIAYYHFNIGDLAGIPNLIISATGYTGSGGFEVYCKNRDVRQVWDAVFKAGAEFGIKPIGLAARDTLRLEMGFCLYGNDIDDQTTPLEAGLGWITKFTKDFVASDILKAQQATKPLRKLVGFEMSDKGGLPRKGYEILTASETPVGHVTSGTMAPSLKKGIGMGYVSAEFAKTGTEIFVRIRDKNVPARIVNLPFYKP